jgi:hypothetical protein
MNKLTHPLNSESAWSPFVHFIPLVGPHYDDGLTNGVRVLILGESHYGDPAQPNFGRNCTHHHFQDYLEECDLTGESQFFQKLPKIITRQISPSPADSVAAWERVAFANAVPSLLAGPNLSPSSEQFAAAGVALRELAMVLNPDAILFLGKRLWDGVPSDVGAWSEEPPIDAEKERRVWLVPTARGFARATWVFHPSRNAESLPSAISVFTELLARCTSGPARQASS